MTRTAGPDLWEKHGEEARVSNNERMPHRPLRRAAPDPGALLASGRAIANTRVAKDNTARITKKRRPPDEDMKIGTQCAVSRSTLSKHSARIQRGDSNDLHSTTTLSQPRRRSDDDAFVWHPFPGWIHPGWNDSSHLRTSAHPSLHRT